MCQNPITAKNISVSTDADITDLILEFVNNPGPKVSLGLHLWKSTNLCICPLKTKSPWFDEVIARYQYCKEFNTPPYPGGYDAQPVSWLEAIPILSNEINALKTCDCARCKRG